MHTRTENVQSDHKLKHEYHKLALKLAGVPNRQHSERSFHTTRRTNTDTRACIRYIRRTCFMRTHVFIIIELDDFPPHTCKHTCAHISCCLNRQFSRCHRRRRRRRCCMVVVRFYRLIPIAAHCYSVVGSRTHAQREREICIRQTSVLIRLGSI